jgi:exocyst complex component 6
MSITDGLQSWNYSTSSLQTLVLNIFEKYSQILKDRFSEDFQEIVATDDYMPMPIHNLEEYNKVVNVSWFTPSQDIKDLTFPAVLPFSQMYPLCCIDIRNFLNQIYLFSDDQFQRSNVIDETLQTARNLSRICIF